MTETSCNIPPESWYCTRHAGHDGPCAALPKATERTDAEIIADLRQELTGAYKNQVYGFFLDGPPVFVQGDKAGEVCDLITADDLNRWLPRERHCKFGNPCPVYKVDPHSTAQHVLAAHGHAIKNVSHYQELVAAVDRDAMQNGGDGIVLRKDEALILQKLVKGFVVGPAGQAVLDKLNSVKE